jgi:terminase small subunit-like protein
VFSSNGFVSLENPSSPYTAGIALRHDELKLNRHRSTAAIGRPALYKADVADRILRELSNGRTLTDVCRDPGMPVRSAVRLWVIKDQDFAARYQQARQIGNPRTGRPTLYTAAFADLILDELCEGRTLESVCNDPGMPVAGTVRQWVSENREGFAAHYQMAREFGCLILSDRLLDIARDSRDDWILRRNKDGTTERVFNHASFRRCELRLKTGSWLLSRMLPRIFGDREPMGAPPPETSDLAALYKEVAERKRVAAPPSKRPENE